MKTLKFVFVITATLMFGLMTSTCTRTSIDDPGMTGYAGYQVILSGTAHPSTLFINVGKGWVKSNITMRANNNDGTPANGKKIMMNGAEFGEFENKKNFIYLTTDAQGIARVQYKVNRMDRKNIGSEKTIKIYAVLQDNNRLDSEGSLIYDYVPITLVTDYEAKDTFAYSIIENPDTNTSTNDIDIDVPSSDLIINVRLINSTGTNTIDYRVAISGTAGLISSPDNNSTGSVDNTGTVVPITVDSTVAISGASGTITFIVTSPASLTGGSNDITITIRIN